MPSVDLGRGRARLAPEHLTVLGQIVHARVVEPELEPFREQLLLAGLIGPDGEPLDFLEDLVRLLAEPALLIEVETSAPDGLVTHGAVISGDVAYTAAGWPGEPEVEYAPVRPALVAAELARMVNLRRLGPLDGGPATLTVPLQVVEGALDALQKLRGVDEWASGQAEMRRVVEQTLPDMPDEERRQLGDVLGAIRLSWRITVSWPDQSAPDGRAARGLVALDCGPLGYWRRDLPPEPLRMEEISGELPVTLTRAGPRRLWNDIAALFPDAEDLT